MPTTTEVAARFIARCYAGFANEFEWQNWLKKHKFEIQALPAPLKKKVLVAWEQATAKEFST